MKDFLELDHRAIQLSVRSGKKFGRIHCFLHNSRNLEEQKMYLSLLGDSIEKQKYLDSEKKGYDVGVITAVANFFENGSHEKIIEKLKEQNLNLNGGEQILRVTENSGEYHVLQKENLLNLKNNEQRGLIACSVWKEMLRDPGIDKIKMKNYWTTKDNFKNCFLFRKVIHNSQIKLINGPEIYERCLIYKNLYKNTLRTFELNEKDIENISPLELSLVLA